MDETRRSDARRLRADAKEQVAALAERRFTDSRFDALRPQPRRRALVVAWGVVTAICVSLFLFDDAIVNLAAILVGGGFVWLLRVVVRAVVDLPDEVLDERMVARRNAVYHRAYTVLTSLVALGLVLGYVAWDASRIAFEAQPYHLNALFWAVLLVGLGLPSAIFAWTEPEI